MAKRVFTQQHRPRIVARVQTRGDRSCSPIFAQQLPPRNIPAFFVFLSPANFQRNIYLSYQFVIIIIHSYPSNRFFHEEMFRNRIDRIVSIILFFFSRSTKIFQLSSMSSNRFTGIGYLRGPWPTPRWRRERLWRTSSNPSRILSDHPATLLSTIVNGSVNGNSD